MNDNSKKSCDWIARGMVIVAIIATFVVIFLQHLWGLAKRPPRASWEKNGIHIHSSDGPWYITHIVAYHNNGYLRAIAQLPVPITIIESGGYLLSHEEINKLIWVDICRGATDPPVVGEHVGILYMVPIEGDPPEKKR